MIVIFEIIKFKVGEIVVKLDMVREILVEIDIVSVLKLSIFYIFEIILFLENLIYFNEKINIKMIDYVN